MNKRVVQHFIDIMKETLNKQVRYIYAAIQSLVFWKSTQKYTE